MGHIAVIECSVSCAVCYRTYRRGRTSISFISDRSCISFIELMQWSFRTRWTSSTGRRWAARVCCWAPSSTTCAMRSSTLSSKCGEHCSKECTHRMFNLSAIRMSVACTGAGDATEGQSARAGRLRVRRSRRARLRTLVACRANCATSSEIIASTLKTSNIVKRWTIFRCKKSLLVKRI